MSAVVWVPAGTAVVLHPSGISAWVPDGTAAQVEDEPAAPTGNVTTGGALQLISTAA